MGTVRSGIDDRLAAWIAAQPMFFVATAPLAAEGHPNLSPKGGAGTLQVLGPHQVAYVDFFGSGIETIAHLKENGRIVVMLCSFTGPPQVVRLHGRGEVVEAHDAAFGPLVSRFDLDEAAVPCVRAAVRIDVRRISDSCGFTVPEMDYVRDRRQLYTFAEGRIRKAGPNAVRDYCDVNNRHSIDGLPGLTPLGSEPTDAQRSMHAHEGRKL